MFSLRNILIALLAVILVTTISPRVGRAVRIQDLARTDNEQPGELVGLGLVIGLKGTGDGGDNPAAMASLKSAMGKLGNSVGNLEDLKGSKDVAIVMVSVSIPTTGAHPGDRLDVRVNALSAKSLRGGRLFIAPLQGPDPNDKEPFGFASGDLTLEDETHTTSAIIRAGKTGGAIIAKDMNNAAVSHSRFYLILQPQAAGYANANAIADQINEEVAAQTDGKAIAYAPNATRVVVDIPASEAAKPSAFMARILALPLPKLPTPARVIIDSRAKTIIITGDVELSPTVISVNGLTITVGAPNQPANPPGSKVNFVALDPQKQGGDKMNALVDAFNLLKVSADDRITIIKELHESGALRADLQID